MAQEILVNGPLTPEMIQAGKVLLKALDSAKLTVTAAFWFFLPEERLWRLVFASIAVKKLGPKAIYMKIASVEKKLPRTIPRIGLQDIAVTEPNTPLILALRQMISTDNGISDIRLSRSSINGFFIEDAHLYRMMRN